MNIVDDRMDRLSKGLWFLVVFLIALIASIAVAKAEEGTASYYTVASCLREGTSGIMANGRALNDNALTVASWYYKFGTKLRITNRNTGRSVVCVVTDRGPSKRLAKKGRKWDLSKRAFAQIASLKSGVVPVNVEVVR